MKEKLKMIIVASVATIGIAGGIACLCLSKDSQDVKQYLDDEKKPTIDDNNINNTKPEDNKDDIQDDVNEPVDNEIENKPVVSKPKPSKPEVSKPSEEVPKEPSNPTLPTVPDVDINDKEELQDLVIANDMVVDGKLIIANKKYNNVKISSDIKKWSKFSIIHPSYINYPRAAIFEKRYIHITFSQVVHAITQDDVPAVNQRLLVIVEADRNGLLPFWKVTDLEQNMLAFRYFADDLIFFH